MQHKLIIMLLSLGMLYFPSVSQTSVAPATARIILQRIEAAAGVNPIPLVIEGKGDIQAETNGRVVRVTTGMLHFVGNEAELAAVLGHEVTHYKHGDYYHQANSANELRADEEGIALAQAIGYNRCTAAKVLLRFSKLDNKGDGVHPPSSYRYKRVSRGCK